MTSAAKKNVEAKVPEHRKKEEEKDYMELKAEKHRKWLAAQEKK